MGKCLVLAFAVSIFGQMNVVDVPSPAMQKTVRCLIITPADYDPYGQAYPTLYLLHGWSGNFASWVQEAPQLIDWSTNAGVVLICPDGGYDSWFLDSPVDSTVRYDSFVSEELIEYVETYYNVSGSPSSRSIAGLSMGGHGALYLALRHPGQYNKAASLAGGLDLRPFKINNWDLEGVLGDPSTHWPNWEQASVAFILENNATAFPEMWIDCGDKDFFLPANRKVHERLKKKSVNHIYRERPGDHNSAYWGTAIDDVLEWIATSK